MPRGRCCELQVLAPTIAKTRPAARLLPLRGSTQSWSENTTFVASRWTPIRASFGSRSSRLCRCALRRCPARASCRGALARCVGHVLLHVARTRRLRWATTAVRAVSTWRPKTTSGSFRSRRTCVLEQPQAGHRQTQHTCRRGTVAPSRRASTPYSLFPDSNFSGAESNWLCGLALSGSPHRSGADRSDCTVQQ